MGEAKGDQQAEPCRESTDTEKALRFRHLHEAGAPLLLPNPWDAGTARLLTHLGFEALGTTSLGLANSLGCRRAARQDVLDNCRAIALSTSLPVTVDLEDGYATTPDGVAETIVDAWRCGAVGASVEDVMPLPESPLYPLADAVERVEAAVAAARSLPIPFVLTARADGLIRGVKSLDDAIRRLQAFEAAGADVLYAPGLRTLDEIRTVVAAVQRPLNVVMGFADPTITLDQLAEVGVARVSIGGALSRLALRAFLDGATAMRRGSFEFVRSIAELDTLYQAFPES